MPAKQQTGFNSAFKGLIVDFLNFAKAPQKRNIMICRKIHYFDRKIR
jgi:hypothetical protein